MNNAELYQKSNEIQKRDAHLCLQEFGTIVKWKQSGARVLDIGCGDGTVTMNILRKYIPPKYEKIVGCDNSRAMVKFCQDNHAGENIQFIILDIQGKLPEMLRNNFDHVVSLYTLHWVKHPENAFANIYDLLAEDGRCWLMFLGHVPVFDIWRRLARMNRWQCWLKEAERYVGPYHDSQEPEKEIKQMMDDIGFNNVKVYTKPSNFTYESVDAFKRAMTAINPFQIPEEHLQCYLEDFTNELQRINDATHNNVDPTTPVLHYSLLIISGTK